ncbi:zinc finger and SCAN domain-containing protein 21-like [Polyodon spathula]|uniref:zinc finger and SCAN domain-containing protein 21-like n=1 Tax=Polyodon spathula TaxID=7913 RepID=UPI001B7DCF7F|nr:zinc finger and SCAN domain-containing protein 21-like [Polyodon spathula]
MKDLSISVSFFKNELGSTIEHAVQAAVDTVLRQMKELVDRKFADFQLEIAEKEKENETLKLRLEISESELQAVRGYLKTAGKQLRTNTNCNKPACPGRASGVPCLSESGASTAKCALFNGKPADHVCQNDCSAALPIAKPDCCARKAVKSTVDSEYVIYTEPKEIRQGNAAQDLQVRVLDCEATDWWTPARGSTEKGAEQLNAVPGSEEEASMTLVEMGEKAFTQVAVRTYSQAEEMALEQSPSEGGVLQLQSAQIEEEAPELVPVHFAKEDPELKPVYLAADGTELGSVQIKVEDAGLDCLYTAEDGTVHVKEEELDSDSGAEDITELGQVLIKEDISDLPSDAEEELSELGSIPHTPRLPSPCSSGPESEEDVPRSQREERAVHSNSSTTHLEEHNYCLLPQISQDLSLQHTTGPENLQPSQQTVKRLYPCTICGEVFTGRGVLRRHRRQHTAKTPLYHCTKCVKSFTRSDHLKTHQRVHTTETPFQCTECGKSFKYSTSLKTHQRGHARTSQHSCTDCGKIHTRIPTGHIEYPCTGCGKSFGRFDNLKEHLKVHMQLPKEPSMTRKQTRSGETQYLCIECGKKFGLLENLIQHQRIHTGGRRDIHWSCSSLILL